ncbi:MAG: hypothetical protein JWM90_583 [Thermoleophilia bacterium]|nr:hypothetical protein [Thermoleophilia bacterium]
MAIEGTSVAAAIQGPRAWPVSVTSHLAPTPNFIAHAPRLWQMRDLVADAAHDLHSMLGAEQLPNFATRPLTVVTDLPGMSAAAMDTASHTLYAGPLDALTMDRGVIAHELMHDATNELRPWTWQDARPPRSERAERRLSRIESEDRAIREGLSDVAGALHKRAWQLGPVGHEFGRDVIAPERLSMTVRDVRAAAANFDLDFDAHAGGAPVTNAFHGTEALGWTDMRTILRGTMRDLAKQPDRPLAFGDVADAMRSTARASGNREVMSVVAQAARHLR